MYCSCLKCIQEWEIPPSVQNCIDKSILVCNLQEIDICTVVKDNFVFSKQIKASSTVVFVNGTKFWSQKCCIHTLFDYTHTKHLSMWLHCAFFFGPWDTRVRLHRFSSYLVVMTYQRPPEQCRLFFLLIFQWSWIFI